MQIAWEQIEVESRGFLRSNGAAYVFRAKVTGGWLVFATNNTAVGGGLTFVPDPQHEWK